MERVLSSEQMKKADEFTVNQLGVSVDELTKRAGTVVADEIVKNCHGGRVLVCLGKGHNGDDGRIIASILSKTHGFTVAVLNVYNGIFKLLDKDFDIIVDCIFGTGLNRNVEGKYYQAIEKINNHKAFKVSCDIPSGLNSDSGKVMGIAVKANLTIAIQEYKLGHFLNDGLDYCGKVIARDIGISIWGEEYSKILNDNDIGKIFPKRDRNSNKGSYGKSAIIGGSANYVGSAILSSNALCAYRGGVGYSYLCIPKSLFNIFAGKNPECIVKKFDDMGGNIVFNQENMQSVLNYNSISIGMGMGVDNNVYQSIYYLLNNYKGNLIIDADGLNNLSQFGVDILSEKTCNVILTPHIGEFARLINSDVNHVMSDSINLAKSFAKTYKVILVLKSSTTIITDGEIVYLNISGCSGMAKAGSGDVLSGLLCGLCAKPKIDLIDVVASGVYIFGKSGELCQQNGSSYSMIASDIVSAIPKIINKFSN